MRKEVASSKGACGRNNQKPVQTTSGRDAVLQHDLTRVDRGIAQMQQRAWEVAQKDPTYVIKNQPFLLPETGKRVTGLRTANGVNTTVSEEVAQPQYH